jgi:hypothetical protein
VAEFLAAYPDYATTAPLDELRATEYSYRDREPNCDKLAPRVHCLSDCAARLSGAPLVP